MKSILLSVGILLETVTIDGGCTIQRPDHFTQPNLWIAGLGLVFIAAGIMWKRIDHVT